MSMKHNSKIKAVLVVSGAMLLAAACAPMDPETGQPANRANPATAQMTKQINVQEFKPITVVQFKANDGAFSDLEKGKLLGFLTAQKVRYGDELEVELPPFTDAAGVNEMRFGALGSFLQDQGFVVKPKLVNDGLRDSLRVFYTKYVATVDPACAKGWHRPAGTSFENLPLPHMGCSTASNLAQMIEKPKDLVSPRSIGAYDGNRAALSIYRYRTGGGSGGGSEEGGSDGGDS